MSTVLAGDSACTIAAIESYRLSGLLRKRKKQKKSLYMFKVRNSQSRSSWFFAIHTVLAAALVMRTQKRSSICCEN